MEDRFAMSEEELEAAGEALEEEVDALLEYLNECGKETTFMLDPYRAKQMELSYNMLLNSIAGIDKEVSVSYFISEANRTVGVLRLEGKNIDAIDIERFSKACEFADATDIYPLTKGVVRIEFTFRRIYIAQ